MGDETAHNRNGAARERPVSDGAVTQILADLRHGDLEARERLVALVYEDLRDLAAGQLGRERVGHTLQPTALVHEAFLRLFGAGEATWENRAHFFGAAGEAMRRVLVDLARRRLAKKRGGSARRVALEGTASDHQAETVLAVDEALGGLAAYDERKRKLVELRFFGGLTMEEAAEALEISVATAKRDWAFAKAWLFRELGTAIDD